MANIGTLNTAEIRHIVEAVGKVIDVLGEAKPADKGQIYRELGLQLVYKPPACRTVSAQVIKGI